jgi:hypothetical protein
MCYFELAAEQQMATHALGYTINDWNCFQPCPRYVLGDGDDTDGLTKCVIVLSELRVFHDREHMHMSVREKDALEVLGVSEATWHSAGVDFERKPWDELTDEERSAAMILGFALSTWNACEEDEGQIIDEHFPTTPPPPPPPDLDPFRVVQCVLTLKKQEFSQVSGMQSVFRRALQVEISTALGIKRERILILNLRKGSDELGLGQNMQASIVVDMIIRQPPLEEMEGEITAVAAFDLLSITLKEKESDLLLNKYVGKYFTETDFIEVKMEKGMLEKMKKYMDFEGLRGMYNDSSACLLLTDEKNGITPCDHGSASLVSMALTIFLAWC